MGGKGPPPKAADQRARRNRDPIPMTKMPFAGAKQPTLPKRQPDGAAWPARTRAWWRRWARDPRAQRFDAAAWDELLDTAVVHARLWSGDVRAASELRLRTARFGVTPDDRARLRISLVDGLEEVVVEGDAEPADDGGKTPGKAKHRYDGLRVVGGD